MSEELTKEMRRGVQLVSVPIKTDKNHFTFEIGV